MLMLKMRTSGATRPRWAAAETAPIRPVPTGPTTTAAVSRTMLVKENWTRPPTLVSRSSQLRIPITMRMASARGSSGQPSTR